MKLTFLTSCWTFMLFNRPVWSFAWCYNYRGNQWASNQELWFLCWTGEIGRVGNRRMFSKQCREICADLKEFRISNTLWSRCIGRRCIERRYLIPCGHLLYISCNKKNLRSLTNVFVYPMLYVPLEKIKYLLIIHVCLFVWGFSSYSRIFHEFREVTITGERLQILIYARRLWPLSSESSLSCRTSCDTGHPFIMVISFPRTRDTHT